MVGADKLILRTNPPVRARRFNFHSINALNFLHIRTAFKQKKSNKILALGTVYISTWVYLDRFMLSRDRYQQK